MQVGHEHGQPNTRSTKEDRCRLSATELGIVKRGETENNEEERKSQKGDFF